MITRPNPMQLATRTAERLRLAWPDGVFLDHPATQKRLEGYGELIARPSGYVEGGVVEAGPAALANGRGYPRKGTIVITLLQSAEHPDLGGTPSPVRFGQLDDAVVRVIEEDPFLGFPPPDHDVQLLSFANRVGYPKLPTSSSLLHYAVHYVEWWATRGES